jgi:hypothetical protein
MKFFIYSAEWTFEAAMIAKLILKIANAGG